MGVRYFYRWSTAYVVPCNHKSLEVSEAVTRPQTEISHQVVCALDVGSGNSRESSWCRQGTPNRLMHRIGWSCNQSVSRRNSVCREVATPVPHGLRGVNVPDSGINVEAVPTGDGCVECLASGGWWLHLRRCATCGHVACCDSSPAQHARHHARKTDHSVVQSFEPGEDWFWDFTLNSYVEGPELAPPRHHPLDQPVPGPSGRVPSDWQSQLH